MSNYTTYYNQSNPSDRTNYNISGLNKSKYASNYSGNLTSSGSGYANYDVNPTSNVQNDLNSLSSYKGPGSEYLSKDVYSDVAQSWMNAHKSVTGEHDYATDQRTYGNPYDPIPGSDSRYSSSKQIPSTPAPATYNLTDSAPKWDAPSYSQEQVDYGIDKYKANQSIIDDYDPSSYDNDLSFEGLSASSDASIEYFGAEADNMKANMYGSTRTFGSGYTPPKFNSGSSTLTPSNNKKNNKKNKKQQQQNRKSAKNKAQSFKKNKNKNKNKNKR